MGLGWETGRLGSVTVDVGREAATLGWVLGLCCWAMGLCFSELGAEGGLLTSRIEKEGQSVRQIQEQRVVFKLYLTRVRVH